MIPYKYLADPQALQYIDNLSLQTQYVKITILNSDDLPLKSIEGYATAGSVNINGSSAVRRTATLTIQTNPKSSSNKTAVDLEIMNEVTNIRTLISINKRVSIEIGIENSGNDYLDYDIFWFPLGKFVIKNASVGYNNNGVVVSMSLSDKMALLNGEIGGVITSQIDLSKFKDLSSGEEKSLTVYEIIHYILFSIGGLKKREFVISDIGPTVKCRVRYVGSKAGVLIDDNAKTIEAYDSAPQNLYNKRWCKKGSDIGYIDTDFIWPEGDGLQINEGETVTSVLDKIKSVLVNFEYFFDVDGIFHFQQIKNYLQEGSKHEDLTKAINEQYFLNTRRGRATYSFNESKLISVYNNNPQYNLIKNDFTVWGKQPETENPIRYHLIVTRLPAGDALNYWRVFFGRWESETNGPIRIAYAKHFNSFEEMQSEDAQWSLGYVARESSLEEELEDATNKDYICVDESEIQDFQEEDSLIEGSLNDYITALGGKDIAKGWRLYSSDMLDLTGDDNNWRLKLYLSALEKKADERDAFDAELIQFFPMMFTFTDIEKSGDYQGSKLLKNNSENITPIGSYNENLKKNGDRGSLVYYLDGINTDDIKLMNTVDVKDLGISDIGRRSRVIPDDKLNCLFPSSVSIDITGYAIDEPIDEKDLSTSTVEKSAYDKLRSVLHESLGYNNNINLTATPIYHLDVNQRISVYSKETDIKGDYIINSMSIPLTVNGTMTINAQKAVEMI